MILKGDKTILRPVNTSDFDYFFNWHSDIYIRQQGIMHPFLNTEILEKDWINSVCSDKSNKKIVFTILDLMNKNPIGYFQLTNINYISSNCYLGIIIGEKDIRGKGYGSDAMKLGTKYAFDFLRLHKISLEVLSENTSAIDLYKKLGFIVEGEFKDEFYFNGRYFNVLKMAKLKNTN